MPSPLKADPEKTRVWQERSRQNQRDNPKPRAAIRKVSKKQQAALREYSARRLVHLEANPHCVRCLEDGEQVQATDIHHMAGRDGERLLDDENFLSVCRYCHEWLHGHPQEAKALGWSQSRFKKGV